MRKRIAYIGVKGIPSQAGADRVVEAVVRGLDKSKYEPIVYCSKQLVPPETAVPGITLIRLWALSGKHTHALSLFFISALHALFFGRYDLIHIHNVEACFVAPILRLRYKVVSTSHGAAQARDKWSKSAKLLISLMEYPYVMFSNRITSVSSTLADYYRQRYQKTVDYFPNGIDAAIEVDGMAAQQLLDEQGVGRSKYIMFAAGRIIPTKGCHVLLEAFAQIPTDHKLIVVGDMSHVPAYAEKLQGMADERVCFIPFVASKATLFGLIEKAELFVFPSSVEAMSMMLLEVASVGVPIVSSDIPENTAVLPNQAIFFKVDDPNDLREKLAEALNPAAETASLGEAAKSWVNQNYRWQTIVPQYEQLYAAMS